MANQQEGKDDLTILVCTANMGNAEPSPQDMAAWIPSKGKCDLVTPLPQFKTIQKERFDLIAVGMQESTWSAAPKKSQSSRIADETEELDDVAETTGEETAAVLEERSRKDMSKLAALLETTLGGISEYQCIAETQRGQMRLVIWGRPEIVAQISDLKITGENTGVAHVLANKGGIVMSFTYQRNTRISFLSAHLAAHEGDNFYKARCSNLEEIFGGTKTHDRYDVTLSSHHLFVMGDLNFRTRFPEQKESSSTTVDQALALIQKGNFEELYKYDELQAGIRRGDLLSGFETLPCHFNPTFKVLRQPGFVYKEQRTPSYTDRILYRSSVKGLLKPLVYEPCPDFASSDHKPIRGAFAITPNTSANKNKTKSKKEPKHSYHLKFRKMSCSDLPSMDVIGKSDPYIMLTWDFVKIASDFKQRGLMRWTSSSNQQWPKTKYLSDTDNPVYEGVELNLFLNGPVGVEAMLYAAVMDYDMNSKDDLIATLPINLRELVAQLPAGQTKTQVQIDQPLLKYGKESGKIKLTIEIEKSDTPIAIEDSVVKGGCCSALFRMFG
ncbi:hypothetical protein ACA910_021580 [Epithemia clementina (nom. ined.)]